MGVTRFRSETTKEELSDLTPDEIRYLKEAIGDLTEALAKLEWVFITRKERGVEMIEFYGDVVEPVAGALSRL